MSELVVRLLQRAHQDRSYRTWLQQAQPEELSHLGLKLGQQAVLLSNLLLTNPFDPESLPDWDARYGLAFPWVDHRSLKIPWTALTTPLSQAKVALITTAGLYCRGDAPFAVENEADGDPTYRVIPVEKASQGLYVKHHLALVQAGANGDTNHLLPIHAAQQLCDEGIIGELAQHHYSFMGYIPSPRPLLEHSAPAVAEHLRAEQVDAVILMPA